MSQPAGQPRRVLIVGHTASARAIALARSVPDDGLVMCIEGDRDAARHATEAFARERLSDRAHVMVGDPALFIRKVAGPFDLIALFVNDEALGRIEPHLERLLAPGGQVLRERGTALG